jgi:hypothetical protein
VFASDAAKSPPAQPLDFAVAAAAAPNLRRRIARAVLGVALAGVAIAGASYLVARRYGAPQTAEASAAIAPTTAAAAAPSAQRERPIAPIEPASASPVPATSVTPAPSAAQPSAAPPSAAPPSAAASAVQPSAAASAAQPSAAASAAQPSAPGASDESGLPSYVDAPSVLYLTRVALRRAVHCHPLGHAVGTADVYITFAPSGVVSDARLEGEPLASAPVARCILESVRAIGARKFNGEPFTLHQTITLR